MSDQTAQGLLSSFLQRRRVNAALPYLNGCILDIGCGNGAIAAYVPPECYYGCDRALDVIAEARTRFPAHTFAQEFPRHALFDTVVALAVLEHMPDPVGSVAEWASYLHPGGRVVLTTPHARFRLTHEAGARIGIFSRDAADEHHSLFNGTALEELRRTCGLSRIVYRRFLFGANQLCVWSRPTTATLPGDRASACVNPEASEPSTFHRAPSGSHRPT